MNKIKHHLFIITILLPLSVAGQGRVYQEDLLGDWYVVSSERKDGSTVIEYEAMGLELPLYWYVDRRQICNYKFPWGKTSCAPYNYFEGRRRIDLETGQQYDIDFIKGDTLIISQINQEKAEGELSRFLLVRNAQWEPEVPPVQMGEALYFSQHGPVMKENDLLHFLYKVQESGRAEYKVMIDFEAKSVSVEEMQSSFSSEVTKERLLKFLNKSYRDWFFHAKDRYPQVVQYLTIQRKLTGEDPNRIWYNTEEQIAQQELKRRQIQEAFDLFQKGLVQFNQNDFYRATDSFTQAYELDSVMIGAVYNRAVVYVKLGDMDKACEDWKHLAERGQVAARDRWRKDCR